MGGIGVALAIVVGLLSSFIQSLGLTIQRKSHIQNDALPLTSQRKPIRRPLWLAGFGIYIITNIFSTIFQLDALPIVILAPLGAVSLIYNALLARLILGDRFGARMVGGTALVASGAVLIAVFGVVEEREHSIEELLVLWGRPAFLAFFWVVIGLTLIVLIVSHIVSFFTYRALRSIRLPSDEDDLARSVTPPLSHPPSNYASPHDPAPIPFRPTSRRWSAPLTPTRHEGLPTLSTLNIPLANGHAQPAPAPLPPLAVASTIPTSSIGHDDPTHAAKRSHAHTVRFAPPPESPVPSFPTPIPTYADPTPAQQKTIMTLGLSFAAASGVISGMSLVLAKAAVELLIITLDHYRTGKGSNQFQHPQSWLLVAGLAIGGLAQLVYLNYSLTFASPALICPLAFCFFNLSSIFDGLVFYDQFSRLATHQIALVSVGVGLLLVGVWVVSVVEPTGQGGVDMGTWVEEEDDETTSLLTITNTENGGFFGNDPNSHPQAYTDEPESDSAAVGSGFPRQYSQPNLSPTHPQHTSPSSSRPDMLRNDTFPFHPPSSGITASPLSPSPMSPTSPRRRKVRYGTLLPELAPVGAPTGFSIGLGAASPGFVLRPGPFGAHGSPGSIGEGRSRSRSEGSKGIQEIIAGVGAVSSGSEAGRGLSIRHTDLGQGVEDQADGAVSSTSGGTSTAHGRAKSPIPGKKEANAGGSWWSRLFQRQGRIRLETDDS